MLYSQNNIKTTLSTPDSISKINEMLNNRYYGNITSFSRDLCKELNLFSPNGQKQVSTCTTALRNLHEHGCICLPFVKVDKTTSHSIFEESPFLSNPQSMTEDLNVVPVLTDEDKKVYNTILLLEYKNKTRELIGRQYKYLIKNDKGECVGIFGVDSPNLNCKKRDLSLGFTLDLRSQYLHYIVNLRHIFMRSGWENYLTTALKKLTERIALDFCKVYGYKPFAIEIISDVENANFDAFTASDFVLVSSGKPFKSYAKRKNASIKSNQNTEAVFLFELDSELREFISLEKKRILKLEDYLCSGNLA